MSMTHNLQLGGIHHLTAITGRASDNYRFYTQTLGLRLVKKTVNQDDVSAYHLFYADGVGSPGSDLTFFDWPAAPEARGTNSIVLTSLRVADVESLNWWYERFQREGVECSAPHSYTGRESLDFFDPEGQRLALVVDDTPHWVGAPWERSPIPVKHQIRGLGPIVLSVPDLELTELILLKVLNMTSDRTYQRRMSDGSSGESSVQVYRFGEGGAAAELHVAVEPKLRQARQGAGGVHHVAFRVPTFEAYDAWNARLSQFRIPSSGPVDRFYFRSLYFREPNGILFELATDEPGFSADEPLETMGESLALPPFLESRRKQIEEGLTPL